MKYLRIILIFLIFLKIRDVEGDDDDCEKKWPSCGKEINTVCTNGGTCDPKDDECKSLMGDKNHLRNLLVRKHNDLRNKLALGNDKRGGAGSAADMMVVNWDFDLEYTASCVANTCKLDHDRCRATKKHSRAGQNLFQGGSEDKFASASDAWYGEITKMTKNEFEKFTGKLGAGHFTQLVWAKTTHIGCAAAHRGGTYILACNYGPGGNMLGARVYIPGNPSTKCPPNVQRDKKYNGLCGQAMKLKDTGRDFIPDSAFRVKTLSNIIFGITLILLIL